MSTIEAALKKMAEEKKQHPSDSEKELVRALEKAYGQVIEGCGDDFYSKLKAKFQLNRILDVHDEYRAVLATQALRKIMRKNFFHGYFTGAIVMGAGVLFAKLLIEIL